MILQVTPTDIGGGAEAIARSLHEELTARGVVTRLAVGSLKVGGEGVTEIPRGAGASSRVERLLARRGNPRAARLCRMLTEPGTLLDLICGHEDFRFPGSQKLLELTPVPPDIVHLHNLHGGYFDLRILPTLAARVALIATLHDAWMLTGHCAHPFDCTRWLESCGKCPYLRTYPGLRRDGTAFNLRRKRSLYAGMRLTVVTPSAWLMNMVECSVLAPAAERRYVIPNGVDLSTFYPGDRAAARRVVAVEGDIPLLLFAAQGGRANEFKDFDTLREALARMGQIRQSPVQAVALGGKEGGVERFGTVTLRIVPQVAPEVVAHWLRAADVYVHASRADTFPLGVLEALACGTPVVASRIGGIPEQVKVFGECEDPTGLLVATGDSRALEQAIAVLLDDPALRTTLGQNAARDARVRFDGQKMVDSYVHVYEQLVPQLVARARGLPC